VYDAANPGYPPYDPLNDPALYMNKDYFEGQWWGAEFMITKKLMERHSLTIGAEYRNDFKQDQMNYDPGADQVYLDDRRDSDSWGLYAQDEYAVFKNLLINLGVRYDHYNIFSGKKGETTNPRAAVIYSPVEKTTFKLLYGTAFRAPNAWEKYYNYPACGLTSNPDVRPEKIQTYEAVYEQYFGDHYRLTAAGFTYKVKDRIIMSPDPNDPLLSSAQNQESVKAEGLELELDGKWAGGLEGTANYTIQQASDSTGERIPNSPRHLAKLKMIIPLFNEKLFAGIEEQYMGPRITYRKNEVAGYYVTNVTLFSRELLKRAEMSAGVYNLFDKKYADPASIEHHMDTIEQDGRTWNAKVTYTF
jgi:iron complex outermembrane receptor protein